MACHQTREVKVKAILLGMNNPLSIKPEHALFPFPVNCTGWRIWQLLRQRMPEVTRKQYLDGFERINLIHSKTWNKEAALHSAKRLPSLYQGRIILVFGGEVRDALDLPDVLIHPVRKDGCEWRQLPHPSGRCRWYNSPECSNRGQSIR